MNKHRYVIQPVQKEGYASVNALRGLTADGEFSREWTKGIGILTGVNEALKFDSLSEAQKNLDEIVKTVQKWNPRWDVSDPKILEIPTKGLELEENEIELFTGCNYLFDKEFQGWDRYAVKEISVQDALTKLAEFKPDFDHYDYQPYFYFWNDLQLDPCRDGFYDGSFKPLYGYQFKIKKFLSENLVSGFYDYSHCGNYRIIDSGYLMPFVRKDGSLRWINTAGAEKYIREYDYSLEDIKPAFESSLDIDAFMKKLEEKLNEKAY